MSSKVLTATTLGLASHLVEVEADTHSGTHIFSIVGLPDAAVKESKDRVDSAIKNSGFEPPHQLRTYYRQSRSGRYKKGGAAL